MRQHRDDPVGRRLDNDDLITHHEETVAAILRDDLDDVGRQRVQTNVMRNHGTNGQREIRVVQRLHVQPGDRLRYACLLLIVDMHGLIGIRRRLRRIRLVRLLRRLAARAGILLRLVVGGRRIVGLGLRGSRRGARLGGTGGRRRLRLRGTAGRSGVGRRGLRLRRAAGRTLCRKARFAPAKSRWKEQYWKARIAPAKNCWKEQYWKARIAPAKAYRMTRAPIGLWSLWNLWNPMAGSARMRTRTIGPGSKSWFGFGQRAGSRSCWWGTGQKRP